MELENNQKEKNISEQKYTNQWKVIFSFVLELIKIIIISLAIIIPIRAYVAQPFYVEGASMEPTFYDKEYLIIDELSYRFNDPQRLDIVIFRPQNNYKVYYIKRIIGLPGETIELKNNQIIIYNVDNPQGFILDESVYLAGFDFSTDNQKTTLGPDEYFVMGDNRNNSLDSRRIGPIKINQLKGKVLLRAYPFNRITIF